MRELRSAALTRALEAIADCADDLADRVRPLEPLASHPSRLHWLDDRTYAIVDEAQHFGRTGELFHPPFPVTDLTAIIERVNRDIAELAKTVPPAFSVKGGIDPEIYRNRWTRNTANHPGIELSDGDRIDGTDGGRIQYEKGW